MNKYLVIEEFNTGESGILYGFLNGENEEEIFYKMEKYFEKHNIDSKKLSLLKIMKIPDKDYINLVTLDGITAIG